MGLRDGGAGRFNRLALALGVAFLLLSPIAPATADPAAGSVSDPITAPTVARGLGPVLVEGGRVGPTAAWAKFCAALPAECQVDRREPRAVEASAGLSVLLQLVNSYVNLTIRPVTDLVHWNVGDRWDYPTDGAGDCEDIQLEKRRLLAALGVPGRAMRMAMVINPEGEGHAVLLVGTDAGDLVLDNRVDRVLPWYRTGYVWVKREGDGARHWVSLGGVRAPVETAAWR